ncbi:NAD-dependent epimerase/dehydratase family protein [Jiangella rhizosphaerae]|uniref:NAD-dependent epimerase/dehydratase family protein n=1 Tax=Jiangella rhizosphaerae TaxID=2293569 RepID=A0A418KV31_9ACTN|nr:NAD-dependent epimerase/dehydratase family protein [Jiangella rhizosphaerae]RIQ33638.1 NAD-dependent epimerase/dehydratase family protein [Jiangella rhizosphaerae]
MSPHAIVVGATGQIGRAAVESLLDHGWAVTAVHRGGTAPPTGWAERGVVERLADRADLATVVREAGGANVLLDTIAYDDADARLLLGLAGDVGSLIVISSASVYADDDGRTLDEATGPDDFPRFAGPVPETQATVAPGRDTYSTKKVLLESALLDDGRLPVTVLRPCAIHGPGSSSPREVWPLLRALARRSRVPLAYRGESRFHTTSAPNLAELVRLAAERPGSRILNAGDPEPLAVAEIVRAVSATVGHEPDLVPLDGPAPANGVGRTPWSVPRSFVVDMTAATTQLGYAPVATYADAVTGTSAWLRERLAERPWREAFPLLARYYGDSMDDFASEDELLATLA